MLHRFMVFLKTTYKEDSKFLTNYFLLLALFAFELIYIFHPNFPLTKPKPVLQIFIILSIFWLLLNRLFNRFNLGLTINSILWPFVLFFSMPFLSTLILAHNDFSLIFLLFYALSISIFIILTSGKKTALMFLLSIMILSISFVNNPQFTNSPHSITIPLFVFIMLLMAGIIQHQKTQYFKEFSKLKLQDEKLLILNNVAASIAHELRTPLQTINLGIHNLKTHILKQNINPHIEQLKQTIHNIENEIQNSFTFINMLLVNVNRETAAAAEHTVCIMSECVKAALMRYPFTNDERKIVTYDLKNDFEFMGNELLTIHIFFNLIKNALYHTKSKKDRRITITLKHGKSKNILYFRDNGEGIPAKNLKHVFDKFYSSRRNGAGIGLEFCRITLESWGGKIVCNSKESEYTEFKLYFPTNLMLAKNHKKWHKLIQNDINILKSQPGL